MTAHDASAPAAAIGPTSASLPREAMATYRLLFLGLAGLIVVAPLVIYPVFVMTVLCFALFACAFNLLLGYAGLLSFGHAAFFGMAAYVTGHAAKVWGLTPELAILLGVAASAGLGLVVGALAIRRQGIYFSMITLALAQMVFFFCLQAKFTHGEDGIQAIPRGALFGVIDLSDDWALYVFIAVVFMAALLALFRIVHSPFGQVLKAIRENEPRAISLGYDAARYKLATFVLSAGFAGLAGSLKALVSQIATLTDVHWSMSGEAILITLVGGVGTVFGPIVGSVIVIAMQNYLAQLGAWVTVAQGVIFVVCVLAFREGIVGVLARRLKMRL
ncbi:branched-chain amino acid ABC transporter permease [Methylopila turkensis]|uniref:Branched-chain amino acid ABC transporter permease n=1 Tax=Methylopila turkensis TaxID=1437816 RepID=A0A9W6JKW6_9HYPH|nr:branched-chain amino acid ABC transporter permease [Methylopila turkensis]